MSSTLRCGGIGAIGNAPCLILLPIWTIPLPLYQSSWVLCCLFEWHGDPDEREKMSFEVAGKERDWHYHIKIEGITGKLTIGIKHFKLMIEAYNILKKSRCCRSLKSFLPLLLHPKLHLTKTKLIARQLQMLGQKIWSSNLGKSHSTPWWLLLWHKHKINGKVHSNWHCCLQVTPHLWPGWEHHCISWWRHNCNSKMQHNIDQLYQ